jgi:Ca-activated chloride channel homolog
VVIHQRRMVGTALAWGLAAFGLFGQVSIEPRARPASTAPAIPSANLRVDTNLVLVPVTVDDALNRPVTGLEKENFRVYDDKVEKTITSFSTEDEPIALGLVFDTSGSMSGTLPQGRQAAAEFLRLANPEDEFFLVEFSSSPRLVIPLTADTGSIHTEVLMSKSGGSTALIDALYLALHEMKKSRKTKKALVLISDGGENHSRYTPSEIKNVVRESDVLIYTITIGARYDPEASYGLGLMSQLAEMTGAHNYGAGAYELPDTAQKICIELRNRYVLGYAPQEMARDGRFHRIEVKLLPPRGLGKLRAHWRVGYYAPSD